MTLLKSIVVCLVLANVGYYLWARGIAESAPGRSPAAPTTLRLASEAGDADRVSGAEAAGAVVVGSAGTAMAGTDSATAAPLLTNLQRCLSVGPFRDVSEAARAAATLRAGHYDPRQRVADGDVWAGVWVYLQIPASRAAAEQMLSKLKAGGIDDALEMPGPNEGSVISLGLFSEPKRAQARVARAQALGFNPGTAERKRTGNVYWIDIDLKPTDSLLNPSDLQGEAGRIVRLEVKACPVSGATS
ncbi:MAG: hypothetical protein M3N50_00480 [Pseudomonadota bacterium]|nr:hypothetical protein [Pseudomonadota bacterium]